MYFALLRSSQKYFETIEKVQDFIYIPYLVALEFHFHKSETLLLSKVNVENLRVDSIKLE